MNGNWDFSHSDVISIPRPYNEISNVWRQDQRRSQHWQTPRSCWRWCPCPGGDGLRCATCVVTPQLEVHCPRWLLFQLCNSLWEVVQDDRCQKAQNPVYHRILRFSDKLGSYLVKLVREMQDVGNSETCLSLIPPARQGFWEEYLRINQLPQLGIKVTRNGPGDLFQVWNRSC